ncbi:hypothetical protein [Oceanobacillus sp. 1P07AA]|uniref:hypothetical protein n=1 Tax=Oceanobacillus sp. 1P07AA TaxID=3132293 RepID=UPI0039A59192
MSISRIMQWVTGVAEALLGIPFIGGIYIFSNAWTPLFVMLLLHILTLILAKRDGRWIAGSVIGIITSVIAWIPIVGMVMHWISAIVLIISGMQSDKNDDENIIYQ